MVAGSLSAFAALLLIFSPLLDAERGNKPSGEPLDAKPAVTRTFEGQVRPLAEIVKDHSVAPDEDALLVGRVFETKDGKVFSLVKDAASRKLFLDDRLLGRPLQITATQIPGTQMLVVRQVQSIKNGLLHDVDYWCEQCQLSATEPGNCRCCGNPVELRELPVLP